MLDQARPGDTVTIPEGTYTGPIRVTKPLVLQAAGKVEITTPNNESVFTILSDEVTIRGINIVDNRINSEHASLVIQGNRNVLEQIVIETMGTGVQLRGASFNTLRDIRVTGKAKDADAGKEAGHDHASHRMLGQAEKKAEVQAKKGNGIDLIDPPLTGTRSNRGKGRPLNNQGSFASIKKTDKNLLTLIRHLVVFSPASNSCMRSRTS